MPMVREDIHFTCDRCGCRLQTFFSGVEVGAGHGVRARMAAVGGGS